MRFFSSTANLIPISSLGIINFNIFAYSTAAYSSSNKPFYMRSLLVNFFRIFIDCMLKKIIARKEADHLNRGDLLFDGPDEQSAREFKIKFVFASFVLAIHGGDFPSLKIIRRKRLLSGNWWIRFED
jgi:hypothetical protein